MVQFTLRIIGLLTIKPLAFGMGSNKRTEQNFGPNTNPYFKFSLLITEQLAK